MKKYAKIENPETKICSVGLGTNIEFYKSIGMNEMDVEQAYNGNWYLEGYAPEKPSPTHDDVSKMREEYRKEHIDSQTAMRSRKIANQTWTADDERAYLDLDAEVTAYIEQHFPYPVGE